MINTLSKRLAKIVIFSLFIFPPFISGIIQAMEEKRQSDHDISESEKLTHIWHLYKHYCTELGKREIAIRREHQKDPFLELDGFYDSGWGSCMSEIQNAEENMKDRDYPNLLKELNIDLSWEDIFSIYQRHGVIQLRKIDENSHTLLLGCGNYPVDTFFREAGHYHKGMITINPEISKNPTIVGAFGIDDLTEVLPAKQFDNLAFEFLGNFSRTEPLLKALHGPYFSHNLDHYHYIRDMTRGDGQTRCGVIRDEDGYDTVEPVEIDTIFEDNNTDNFW